jgi:hypothetical protein
MVVVVTNLLFDDAVSHADLGLHNDPNKDYQITGIFSRGTDQPSTSVNLTSTCMHPSRRTYIPCVPATRCTSQNVVLVSSSLSTQPADLSWPLCDLFHPTNLFCRIPVVGPRTYGRKRYSGLKILS